MSGKREKLDRLHERVAAAERAEEVLRRIICLPGFEVEAELLRAQHEAAHWATERAAWENEVVRLRDAIQRVRDDGAPVESLFPLIYMRPAKDGAP